ncbi:hypothetical protein BGZ58_006754, partial [Dissophora ornata]
MLPLPPYSTSVTQPLDAGIIAVFKRRYRDYIASLIVRKTNDAATAADAVSIMSKGAEAGGAVDAASGLNDGVTIEEPPKIK